MASSPTFGSSLELDDGDLVLAGGRLAAVSGLPNLIQALALRVLTPFGDDQFNTTYGFDATAVFGQAATARTLRDLIQLNLAKTLGADPRVSEIRDVTFLAPPDGSQGRSWPVLVTIVAADGSQQAIPLTVEA
jgi:hypothetical protein